MNFRNKQIIIIFIIGIAIFYLMPFLIYKIIPANFGMFLSICMLLILNSIYSYGASFFLSKIYGFKWYFPILIGAIFTPSIYIFYNVSANIYILVYIVLGYVGCFRGQVVYKKY